MGMIDDRRSLSAGSRLGIQAIAGLAMWAAGFRLEAVQLGPWMLDFGIFALPLTLFWFMGFMNTSNIMDGMDGLSGGMNLIALSSLAIFSLVTGFGVGPITLVVASMVLAFLFFNLSSRRKAFLGDSGA